MAAWTKLGVAVLGAAIWAQSALAADIVDATDPDRLVSIIRDLGYRAKLDTDDVGDPLIRSSVGGTKFVIIFYGCDEISHTGCEVVMFKVGYDLRDGVSLETINLWNATELFGRAYRDDVNDPWLEMPVVMKSGVSRENFETAFEWWEVSVDAFEDHIGNVPGEPSTPQPQSSSQFTTMASPDHARPGTMPDQSG